MNHLRSLREYLEGKVSDLETAFATVEQGTARTFLESLGRARAQTVGRVRSELMAQERELLGLIRQTDGRLDKESSKARDKRNPELIGTLLDKRKALEGQLQQLIVQMEKESPQYTALKYPQPCTVAQACSCLAENEVALLFVPGDEKSYVVLLEARPADDKASGLGIFELPAAAELADVTTALTDRDCLSLPARLRSAGAAVYQAILSPLTKRIKDKDLVIVPGGPLCQLPFELLIEDGKYLIENHRIRYAPSMTALYLGRRTSRNTVAAVVPPRGLYLLDRRREVHGTRAGRHQATGGNPLMSWMYGFLSTGQFAALLGVVDRNWALWQRRQHRQADAAA